MPTTLKRALVGLGLAGALFLGAGAAIAQTTGDGSSSGTSGGAAPLPRRDRGGQSQPRRLKIAYRVRLTSSIRARAKG